MKCSIQGCPGEYEERGIVHTVQRGEDILVFANVPAEVCSVCGDTILSPETVRHLEELIARPPESRRTVPVLNYR